MGLKGMTCMKKYILTLMMLALLIALTGCAETPKTVPLVTELPETETTGPTAAASVSPEQRLRISVNHADSAYSSKEVSQGPNTDSNIGFCCIGLSDAAIFVDGAAMDLENAIQEGKTSLGEIASLAQADARAGFCEEGWESENGLAKFRYSYPGYDLWITNDIYETPDGLRHLIRQITLAQPGSDVFSVYPDLDQEDWGIEFSVLEASPSSVTLNYSQSGGQLIGQLVTGGYEISRLDPMEAIPRLDSTLMQEQIQIPRDSQGSVTLDLETYFGILPAGEYGMYLYLKDEYDEEDIPPLTKNYHDTQCYWIEFSVH